MRIPVDFSGRRDEATSPATMNEIPATIVKPASARLSPLSCPLPIAAAPNDHAAHRDRADERHERVRTDLGTGCGERGGQPSRLGNFIGSHRIRVFHAPTM